MKRLYWTAGVVALVTLVTAILIARFGADNTGAGIGAEPIVRASRLETPTPVIVPKVASPTPIIGREPVPDLQARRFEIPVKGVSGPELHSSFDEARDGHRHEAMDILAPRNTPVVAVEDGTVQKLFTSKAGGLTIYQFDPTATYCYYYAHLERYADQIKEGDTVHRGEVIGYVGTSGNAPKNTPHLHFAIFKLTQARQWWQGAPIDPFTVLVAAGGTPR